MTNSKVRHAPPRPGRRLAVQASVLILSLCGQTGSDPGVGAKIVDPVDLGDREGMDEAEFEVLLYEFRAGLNDYLGDHRVPNGVRTLADLIAFNVSRREEVMPFFGQEILVMAEDKGPLTEGALHRGTGHQQTAGAGGH